MADNNANGRGSNANGLLDSTGSVSGAPSSVARGDSPAVSELTTPSLPTRNRPSVSDARRIEYVSLADKALRDEDQPVSPVRRIHFTPEEEEEMHEKVNGQENPGADDSDDEEEEELGLATNESEIDRGQHDEDIRRAVGVEDSWADYIASYQEDVVNERESGRILDLLNEASLKVNIPGAPIGWIPPMAPPEWKPNAAKIDKKQPNVAFGIIDNPGNWSEYVYCPKFQGVGSKGDYVHHSLPSGAMPVPASGDGKRAVGGFKFFYQGWQKEVPNLRTGATRDNMWPIVAKVLWMVLC